MAIHATPDAVPLTGLKGLVDGVIQMSGAGWTIVVAPMPEDRANRAFEAWRTENQALASKLGERNILKDRIRSKAGDLVRYRVRVPAIPDGLE